MGEIPYQWNAGLIFFIPKMEGVVLDIKNRWPITILNTIYEIYAKVHSLCMQPLFNDIIHKSQTGFMQELSIFYNISMFWELITFAKEKDEDIVVLLLDLEKAYDRVYRCFLEEVMLQLGFPMAWVVAVRALYKNASSSVYVVGEVDTPFSISRSVRQGCPLAPFLYLLIIEAFHVYFNNHAFRIKGLQSGVDNKQVLDTKFADDTTLYVDGEE